MKDIELTDELWVAFGFTKGPTMGGSQRWRYYKHDLKTDKSYYDKGGSVDNGTLSFLYGSERNPKTVIELHELLLDALHTDGHIRGRRDIQQKFHDLMYE